MSKASPGPGSAYRLLLAPTGWPIANHPATYRATVARLTCISEIADADLAAAQLSRGPTRAMLPSAARDARLALQIRLKNERNARSCTSSRLGPLRRKFEG